VAGSEPSRVGQGCRHNQGVQGHGAPPTEPGTAQVSAGTEQKRAPATVPGFATV